MPAATCDMIGNRILLKQEVSNDVKQSCRHPYSKLQDRVSHACEIMGCPLHAAPVQNPVHIECKPC